MASIHQWKHGMLHQGIKSVYICKSTLKTFVRLYCPGSTYRYVSPVFSVSLSKASFSNFFVEKKHKKPSYSPVLANGKPGERPTPMDQSCFLLVSSFFFFCRPGGDTVRSGGNQNAEAQAQQAPSVAVGRFGRSRIRHFW